MTPLGILLVAMLVVVAGILVLRLHPFVVLSAAAFAVALLTPDAALDAAAGQRVAEGFGRTAVDVGIVIAMASILGTCLSDAGGAQRIVLAIQRAVGERRTPLALLLAAFVLGVPMFAETVLYLLLPLARASWMRNGRGYLLGVLAILAGATMTHSLVPPTPGPLFVANELGVDMATMIGMGLAIGFVAALAGFAYARWADHRWPLVPTHHDDAQARAGEPLAVAGSRMPPLWAALLPIMLPVVLISLASVAAAMPLPPEWLPVIHVVGEKNLALAIAAVAAMLVLARSGASLPAIRQSVGKAVTEAGGIVLVISAGGALGATLRQAGLADVSAGLASGAGWGVIAVAWLVTAIIRVAQGSATVAMITAAGVMAPIMLADGAGIHPVYVAIAIGCGSKIGMWMNDSGFWVISRMSGMTEVQTLRAASAMVAVEGTVGLVATLVAATLWPLQ